MAQIPFVDTHIHFSDLREQDLAYAWLEPEFVHPVLGDIGASASGEELVESARGWIAYREVAPGVDRDQRTPER